MQNSVKNKIIYSKVTKKPFQTQKAQEVSNTETNNANNPKIDIKRLGEKFEMGI